MLPYCEKFLKTTVAAKALVQLYSKIEIVFQNKKRVFMQANIWTIRIYKQFYSGILLFSSMFLVLPIELSSAAVITEKRLI